MRYLMLIASAFAAVGCGPPMPEEDPDPPKKTEISLSNPKFTDKIGKFDPNAGREVSDSKGKYSNPITGALEMYGPTLEKISKMHIDQAVRLFEAENGRYPRDYDEFMEKIIKRNNIKLPVLPRQMEYQYDEENHKLVVVKKLKQN